MPVNRTLGFQGGTMGTTEYEEEWQNYLKNFFQGIAAPLLVDEDSGLPYLFASPICATCQYWYPIHRDGLNQLPAPHEYDLVEKGLNGKIIKTVSLGEGEHDAYSDHVFYGWCKRYPPTNRDTYSIIGFRSLFSLVSRKIPQKVADYQFPLLSHTNTCGEWKQGEWVESFVNEYKKT